MGKENEVRHEERTQFAGLDLSNPYKVLYPELGITKSDLAAYYEAVVGRMLPLVKDRPVSLLRCPDGRGSKGFFEKHCTKNRGWPSALKLVQISERSGPSKPYGYLTGLSSLIAGVQMGTLEFHIWGSRIDDLEKPDRMVLDIDPGEGITFADVRQAAFEIRDEVMERTGLRSVALMTGGKGIHVVVPLVPSSGWEYVRDFSREIAKHMESAYPNKYVTQAGMEKRKGLMFIDYLRNARGATAVAPYSTRNRLGVTVAAPVTWEELERIEGADEFNVRNMMERVDGPDPWEESHKWKQKLMEQ